MSDSFECQQCESPSVVFPQEADDDAHLICRRCGAPMGTISQLRDLLAGAVLQPGRQLLTGC